MSISLSAWAALRAENRQEGGWHLRRIYPQAHCELFGAIRQPGEKKGLILEVPSDAVAPDIVLPQSKGFSVETQLLGSSAHGQVRFSLVLSDAAYETVFAVLCDHVSEATASAPSPRMALREWVGQLHVWQDFLARHGTGGLSDEAVVGLIGELLILHDELIGRVGAGAAIAAWAGPRGEPNDFELLGGFLEIKATARQAPDVIQIANLNQLNDERGLIVLANVRLRADSAGQSLPDLVSQVRERIGVLDPRLLREFNASLLAVGYVDVHAGLYPGRWVVRRIDYYEVRENFPRLIPSDVRPGVRSASYSIVVADCAPFLVGAEVLVRLTAGQSDGR